ncbi:MAG: HAMP domain-containing sensor histidine kinase [Coriobacteriales bacterium]|nr:HAMP domain-containing sensor histidine kinase [Coriobacteriales bacterium]
MERRLRVQLVATVFISLAVLLGVVTLITRYVDSARMDSNADDILEIIMRYDGSLPDDLTLPETGTDKEPSEEATKEARYFVLHLDSNGDVVSSNLDYTTRVTQQQVAQYAQDALRQNTEKGYVGTFRFLVQKETDGGYTIAFLDRQRQMDTLAFSVQWEAILSLIAALALTGIVALLSKHIVKPIIDSQRRQRQFVTNAGHDLRTPVSIISADADVLALDLGENEWIDDIKKQVRVMTDLTESLVTLAKAGEGVQHDAQDVDLSDVVSQSVKGFGSRAQLEGHQLETQVQAGVHVAGEPSYLERMTSQLVDNALKYSSEGTPIQVSLGRKGSHAILVVRNQAEHVDPSEVKHWFDRFYQSDKARTHSKAGFGIGLSMVEAVAEAHGGKVVGEATPDGSTVTIAVTLPVQKGSRHEKH